MKQSGRITQLGVMTMACSEQPQARFDNFGAAALSDTELLALILNTGTTDTPVWHLAAQLIAEAGSLTALLGWSVADYQRVKGIGACKARQLVALAEMSRRMHISPLDALPLCNTPELIADYMKPIASGLEIEKFWVLCLNRKNRLKKLVEVTSGTATASLAHPREVYREAIRASSSAIICVHNHPSGDPAPSSADIQVTRVLREAARTVDIELLDHVILGKVEADPTGQGWYSFRQAGLI